MNPQHRPRGPPDQCTYPSYRNNVLTNPVNKMDKKEQQAPSIEQTPGMQYIIDLLTNVKTNTTDVKNSDALFMMDKILDILEREKWIEQRHIVKAHHAGMIAQHEKSMLRKLFYPRPSIDESIKYFENTYKTAIRWR